MQHIGRLFIVLSLVAPATFAQSKTKVRIGHFPNLTHAQGVIAHGLSRAGPSRGDIGPFEKELGPDIEIEWFVYNAGPSAMEALLAGSIDVTYVGPNPAINAHLKSGGDEVRIVAGAASGGAALVVQPDGRIRKDADFKGKRIGTPQLGNTQDVAARAWLATLGIKTTQTGGDAFVLPTANPDQLALFQKGDLDAVWTVEPWVTRLELEAKGQLYLEEKKLWPETGGRYVTTHLVSSTKFLAERAAVLEKILAAHVALTDWIRANETEAKAILNAEMKVETTKAIAAEVLDRAWTRIELTSDPLRASLLKSAEAAHAAGFLREKPDLSRIYDLTILNRVLERRGRPRVD